MILGLNSLLNPTLLAPPVARSDHDIIQIWPLGAVYVRAVVCWNWLIMTCVHVLSRSLMTNSLQSYGL